MEKKGSSMSAKSSATRRPLSRQAANLREAVGEQAHVRALVTSEHLDQANGNLATLSQWRQVTILFEWTSECWFASPFPSGLQSENGFATHDNELACALSLANDWTLPFSFSGGPAVRFVATKPIKQAHKSIRQRTDSSEQFSCTILILSVLH